MRLPRVFDPQNGVRDAKLNMMRAVRFDYPDEPIAAGSSLSRLGVLWIRILHYAGALGLTIEPVTDKWLHDHVSLGVQEHEFGRAFFTADLRLSPAR